MLLLLRSVVETTSKTAYIISASLSASTNSLVDYLSISQPTQTNCIYSNRYCIWCSRSITPNAARVVAMRHLVLVGVLGHQPPMALLNCRLPPPASRPPASEWQGGVGENVGAGAQAVWVMRYGCLLLAPDSVWLSGCLDFFLPPGPVLPTLHYSPVVGQFCFG
jgi:hypothetical protein